MKKTISFLYKNKVVSLFFVYDPGRNQIVLVAKKSKKVVGYCSLNIRLNMREQGLIGVLTELIVDKDVRGQGLGKKLMKEMVKQTKKKKCREIQLSSTFPRKKAHKFYQGLGFKNTAYLFWKKI